jgi:hypothetical protein
MKNNNTSKFIFS